MLSTGNDGLYLSKEYAKDTEEAAQNLPENQVEYWQIDTQPLDPETTSTKYDIRKRIEASG